MTRRRQKRGAYSKEDCVFIGAWIPTELMDIVDEFVVTEDTDRSKLLRRALEEKIQNPKEKAA
jgi:metal-responsive CopG/Arc/MetJ family transcriptional regulator